MKALSSRLGESKDLAAVFFHAPAGIRLSPRWLEVVHGSSDVE